MQMELTELQCNDASKDAFPEDNLSEFYARIVILIFTTAKAFASKLKRRWYHLHLWESTLGYET